LEHIYPENPQSGPRIKNHNLVVNRLGNLRLLARLLNKHARNADFATKELSKYSIWNMDSINVWQQAFSKLVLSTWSFAH
jgi:uncharacterized protein DUF1524